MMVRLRVKVSSMKPRRTAPRTAVKATKEVMVAVRRKRTTPTTSPRRVRVSLRVSDRRCGVSVVRETNRWYG